MSHDHVTQPLRQLLLFGLITLIGGKAEAVTNVVTTLTDGGPGSLRQAILDANASGGGTILFSNVSGKIRLGSDLPTISTNLKILGPGKDLLTISGSNS